MGLRDLPAFLFALGVIIFVHEFGHLAVAKLFNMRVLAFSLGFGKRLWGFTRGETDYRLSLVPLGGYVKLGGEHADEATADPRDFMNRPRWQRILVYLAGPVMNVVLAIALVAGLFMVGIEIEPRKLPPVIGGVVEGSPAAIAGLVPGDRVVAIDGQPITEFKELQFKIIESPARSLAVVYVRNGERRTTTLTPLKVERYELGDAGIYGPGVLRIRGVVKGKPAEAAGFKAGDVVLRVNGREFLGQGEFVAFIQQHPGEQLEVEVRRDGKPLTLSVTPEGEKGGAMVGVEIRYGYFQRYPFGQAIAESTRYNFDQIKMTFVVLKKVFTGTIAAKSAFAGPLEIMAITGDVARQGFGPLIHLMAFLSISIGIVNMLPIPVLDGGQITILAAESVLRRDLSLVVKERLAQVGVLLIVALMATVIFFDLQKRF